jgi:hypothetical protein
MPLRPLTRCGDTGSGQAVRVGSLLFDEWQSLLLNGGWSDTFVYRLSANDGLPPVDYARAVRRVVPPLLKLRHSASLWVAVESPAGGTWYAEQVRRTLHGISAPVAVTNGIGDPPHLNDFSFFPWTERIQSPPPPQAENPVPEDISANELRCLQVLARLEQAYTLEVASLLGCSRPTARKALNTLRERDLLDYYPESGRVRYPYWEIRRRGVSLALRSWGVSAGVSFPRRKERRYGGKKRDHDKKVLYVGGRHRSTSRLWPAWLRKAWPDRATIWAGWSEVFLGGSRPDALAWGLLNERETIFWLEVESGNRSKVEIARKAIRSINKAILYVDSFSDLDLVVAFLGPPWVLGGIKDVLSDVPGHVAVVLAGWTDFGVLPEPVRGKVEG